MVVDYNDELGILKVAYANCVNDLVRAKANIKEMEDALFALSQMLRDKAVEIQAKREDNPGTLGSGH